MSETTVESPWVDRIIHTESETDSVVDKVHSLMREAGWPEDDQESRHFFGMRLAMKELMVNAIKHGNEMNPEKSVYIRHQVTRTEAIFSVQDSGSGFYSSEIPSPILDENIDRPCGRGIFLAREFATELDFIPMPSNQAKTNHVRIVRRINHKEIVEQREHEAACAM